MINSRKQTILKITYKEGVNIMKKMTRFLALALSAVVAAGSFAPVTAEAASNTISRVGNKERAVYVGKEFELEYALINMPEKFNYILNKVPEDNKNMLKFVAFNENIGLSEEVKENLELFGALYLSQFNKNQIF